METFDLPDNFVSCSRRTVSTVAPQAATLLNNPFTALMAQSFAARLEKEAGAEPANRVSRAWRLAFGRDPLEAERMVALKILQTGSLSEFCRVVMNLNEFVYLD